MTPGVGRVDVSIVTSGHDVADARLHREVAALVRAGLRVEVLGLGEASAGPPDAVVRARPRRSGVRRALDAALLPWRASGRVLVALDPDSTATAVVRRLVSRGRVRVVADVHEDYEALLRDRAWAVGLRALGGRVWARLGLAAARRADLLVVADHHLLSGSPSRLVLRNLPDVSMLPGPTERDEQPRALYVGDLRRSRGLFAMLDAVAAAPGWSLDLVGPVAERDTADLEARLAAPALAGRVRLHGRRPPREAWELARGAWVGLLLLEDTPAFRAAVPSKLYEYLACGLAVVTSDLPRAAEIVRSTGTGAVVADAAEAARTLEAWAADPAAVDEHRRSAVTAAAPWVDGVEVAAFARAVRDLVEG